MDTVQVSAQAMGFVTSTLPTVLRKISLQLAALSIQMHNIIPLFS